jgi:hypothetical protein
MNRKLETPDPPDGLIVKIPAPDDLFVNAGIYYSLFKTWPLYHRNSVDRRCLPIRVPDTCHAATISHSILYK